MPPKRTAATTTPAPMTNAAIKQLIAQGVADALAEIEANRTSRNGDDSYDSGTGVNSYVKTVGHDAAYEMPWKTLKKMITAKYCPRGEIKKLEIKLWNLKESNEVKKYVGGLPGMIRGSVMASKPKTMQDAIEFVTELMDQKIHRPILLGPGKRKCTRDLNLRAPNATTIMMGSVLPSAPTVRGMAIWPGTIRVQLLLPTTKETSGQIKGVSLAMNVGFRSITRRIARSYKTRIREIKLGMVMLWQGLVL
ncbi:hypothetical protein Tco_0622094 [Tanacetum coccineum]